MPRYPMQTAMRAACVDLLEAYKTATTGLRLQVYPGRPRSLNPPTAFVDGITERIEYTGLVQRHPTASVILIHGIYDSMEAANQKDAFVDGFLDWCIDNIHAAGANTTIGLVGTEDIPDFVPDWLPPAEQKTYYATRIELEGLALSG